MASYKILHHRVSFIEAAFITLDPREVSLTLKGTVFLILHLMRVTLVRVSEELKTLLLKIVQAPTAQLSDPSFLNTVFILDFFLTADS